MKRTASATAVAAAVLLTPVAVAGTASADPYYANCKAAFAAGHSNIRQGEPGYRPGLDRDHDGIACEEGDPAAAAGGVGSPAQGVSDTQPSTAPHEGSGTSNQSSTSSSGTTASSGSSEAQVAVVPQGGAETGDGSTAGHPGWWIGGALLAGFAAVAGVATARRSRVRSGR